MTNLFHRKNLYKSVTYISLLAPLELLKNIINFDIKTIDFAGTTYYSEVVFRKIRRSLFGAFI